MKTFAFSLLSLVVTVVCSAASAKTAEAPSAPPAFVDHPNTLIGASRPLTFVGTKAGEGYFSADGQKMIYQSEREPGNPFYQMFVMDLASGSSTRLSPGKGKTTCGWIHPSGQKAMWSSTHLDPQVDQKAKDEYAERAKPVKQRYSWNYDENYDIFESDLQGKHIKRLTHEKGYDAEGSYSPDGQWIAFASNRAGYTEKLSDEDAKIFAKDPSYMMDIYLMKSDGTQVKRLTDAKGYDGGPFFSADGQKITWRRFAPNGMTAEVYTMNLDGSDQRPVTHLGAMSWAPFFHPSGDYIIFATSALGFANFELFIVDTAGNKQPVRASFLDGFDGLPVFTPDGNHLAWTHRNEKGESQILLADWDDNQARQLLGLSARDPGPQGLSSQIREADVRRLVQYMASPEMNGRQTGSREEHELADKWVSLFKAWGLQGGAPDGGFLERFEFTSAVKLGPQSRLQLTKFRELKTGSEAEPYSMSAIGPLPEAAATFAGYGLRAPATDKQPAYDSYKELNVKGRWAVVLRDLPDDVGPDRRQHLAPYARLQHKVTVAREAGAVGLIVIDGLDALKPLAGNALRFEGSLSESSLPAWRVGGGWINDWLKSAGQNWKDLKPRLDKGELVSFELPQSMAGTTDLVHEKAVGTNVIARLSFGRAKASPRAVLIGAHGDHLGHGQSGQTLARGDEAGQVHPGADDNASGVSALLEIAHELSARPRKQAPKQDVYFAVWSGEEIGLLGSAAFLRDWEKAHRAKPSATFTANLNMDMVGRLRERLEIQGTGSAEHWDMLAEELSARSLLPLALSEDPYLPTDSMSFYLAGIPAVNLFTGSHAEYHTPRDKPETLNYPGLVRVASAVEDLTLRLAARDASPLKFRQVAGRADAHLEGRTFRVYLGTVPDYTQEGIKGVKLSGVSKDSPAEKAGLKTGDVITEFAGTKIENLYDYVYGLQSAKPKQETTIKILRGNEAKTLKIVPLLKD